MNKFEVHILGCGSALPTKQHNPSSQILNIREKLFMVDCGEGTQLQMRLNKLKMNRLSHIFISHLHGDHCFGLIGLISTLALLGRNGDVVIHADPQLETLLRPQLNFFCKDIPFNVIIEGFDSTKSELIYEDKSITVHTIPLIHRVPCAGFLFREKSLARPLNSEIANFYKIPVKDLPLIKQGADYITEDGEVISNSRLTFDAPRARSYAYCSDTAYSEALIPIIKDVDVIYHESTFLEADAQRAKSTGHSTAKQAATIAKEANVGKLLLGHYSSRYNDTKAFKQEAAEIFINVEAVNEGYCEKL